MNSYSKIKSQGNAAALLMMAATVVTMPKLEAVNPPPDAGRILQELQDRRAQPPASDNLDILPAPDADKEPLTEDGPSIRINTVTFNGNTIFSDAELTLLLQPALGNEFKLSGLLAMAETVSLYYRSNGYPFARALLPPQEVSGGILKIEILEGRYGKVRATSEHPKLAQLGKDFLSPLKPGTVIESDLLERQSLLLNDLPGISTIPVIRPGANVGEGDFEVTIHATRVWDASVGFDNHGNRYTGEYRATTSASYYHLYTPGDRVSGTFLYTNEDLWLGRIGYDMPIGSDGLRGHLSYARTDYDLGYGFDGFTGLADVATIGISYPMLRSQQSNAILIARTQYKNLNDKLLDVSFQRKDSYSGTIGIEYDHRDNLFPSLGRGMTFGSLYLTAGSIESDDAGVNTGGFAKLHGDISRLQSLPGNFSWFTNIDFQIASGGNLDSSESMLLGGANSVRAYPQGEAASKAGIRLQNELRYSMKYASPYVFYDIGYLTSEGTNSSRTLSGAGFGVRVDINRFYLDASVASRISGGDSRVETNRQRDVRGWVTAGYRF